MTPQLKQHWLAGIAIVAAGALASCGSDGTAERPAATTTSPVAAAPTTPSPPTTAAPSSPVSRFVIVMQSDTQYDQTSFDNAVDYGASEYYDRELIVECADSCELVFDDAKWFWTLGLRIPIVNGRAEATLDFEYDCTDRGGVLRGAAPIVVTADLDVESESLIDGRTVPTDFTGTIVMEFGSVGWVTDTGQGECSPYRHTLTFPAGAAP